jgi:hypothetical protein
MRPLETWKKNKWRIDLRTYTRSFQKNFEAREKVKVSPGEVYAAKYLTDPGIITDKYHFTPVFVSFGRFRDDEGMTYTRSINLMYLRNEQKIELLEDIYQHHHKTPEQRVEPIIQIHEKWMRIAPYAFKNLEERRITGISKVSIEEWGMIPLLKEELLGTFNSSLLNEDFQKENKAPVEKKKKKQKPVQKSLIEEEVETVSEEFMEEGEFIDWDDDI